VPQAFRTLSIVFGVALVALVRAYQVVISPVLVALGGARCRFAPSCSQYAIESIRHYGPIRGTWRAMKRLGRCHPFHPGGYDPAVPTRSVDG
jgi:uncharacterized protein